jgi:hypothetical protein
VDRYLPASPCEKKATYVKLVRLAAGCCGLLLMAACAGPYSDAAPDVQPLTSRSTSATTPADNNRLPLGNGLMITVSAPKTFTPTETAYPRTPRAVAFDLIIDNESTAGYRPSQLAVTATCNGAKALQVIDSTQGYPGSVAATDEVPPGQQVRLAVAFAVPSGRTGLALTVQPNQDGPGTTVFEGTV